MTSTFDLFLLSLALAMDCFTVSTVSGVILRRRLSLAVVRMAVLFGLFQGAMPFLGWLAAATFSSYVEAAGHWIAFLLLSLIGGKMVWESLCGGSEEHSPFDPRRLTTQLLLAVATSIDALAVGVSMACVGYNAVAQLWLPLLMIGGVSLVLSLVGYGLGVRFGRTIAQRLKPELMGGVVLIAIGLKVLFEHLLS